VTHPADNLVMFPWTRRHCYQCAISSNGRVLSATECGQHPPSEVMAMHDHALWAAWEGNMPVSKPIGSVGGGMCFGHATLQTAGAQCQWSPL
jgi:hypothetical protein